MHDPFNGPTKIPLEVKELLHEQKHVCERCLDMGLVIDVSDSDNNSDYCHTIFLRFLCIYSHTGNHSYAEVLDLLTSYFTGYDCPCSIIREVGNHQSWSSKFMNTTTWGRIIVHNFNWTRKTGIV